jgi:TatD DNase family protein
VIETHCHLNSSRFQKDRAAALERARRSGVTAFVEVGYDVRTSERAVALAAAEPDVWATVGLHPHEVAKAAPEALAALTRLARAPRVVAVGEIGLDFYRDLSPRGLQREWLRTQLALAAEADLPVVIHTRDAWDEMLDILSAHGPRRRGILHCYSGTAAQARRAVELGYALGFGGSLTYGDAELEAAVREAPRTALVLETDAPYLVPAPKDVKRNEPALLARVRAAVAALRGETAEEVDAFTTENARRVLALTAG